MKPLSFPVTPLQFTINNSMFRVYIYVYVYGIWNWRGGKEGRRSFFFQKQTFLCSTNISFRVGLLLESHGGIVQRIDIVPLLKTYRVTDRKIGRIIGKQRSIRWIASCFPLKPIPDELAKDLKCVVASIDSSNPTQRKIINYKLSLLSIDHSRWVYVCVEVRKKSKKREKNSRNDYIATFF